MVDLTPDGAALVCSQPMPIGELADLQMELPSIHGRNRTVRVRFTVRSARSEGEDAWRVGGTLEPRTPDDAESLIEYCHVVSSRTRLTRSGRIDAALFVERPPAEVREHLARVAQL